MGKTILKIDDGKLISLLQEAYNLSAVRRCTTKDWYDWLDNTIESFKRDLNENDKGKK